MYKAGRTYVYMYKAGRTYVCAYICI